MGCATDDQEGGDSADSQTGNPMRDVERPSIGRAQWSKEVFLLDQSPGSNGEFDVCWPTPDGSNNCEYYGLSARVSRPAKRRCHTYPPLYMACKFQGIV